MSVPAIGAAAVLGGAMSLRARLRKLLSGLIEWTGDRGKLTVGSPTSLALIGSFGALAFLGAGVLATLGGGGTAPTAEATPAADVFEDFSTYAALSNLLNDDRNIYDEGEHFCNNGCANAGDGDILLDTGVGGGVSDRSARMDWTTYGSAGAGGTMSLSPSLPASTTRAWVEVDAIIESGFQIDNGFTGGVGWKWLFINRDGGGSAGRYALEWTLQDGTLSFYPPDSEWGASEEYHLSLPYSFENFNDGLEHQYRMLSISPPTRCALRWTGARCTATVPGTGTTRPPRN